MLVKQNRRMAVLMLAFFFLIVTVPAKAEGFREGRDTFGPEFEGVAPLQEAPRRQAPRPGDDTIRRLRFWNQVAIDTSGIDHTPGVPGEGRVFGEQLGPGRASRAMAIVHIAMFDAVNAVIGGYRSYTGLSRVFSNTSIDAAIAQAAHDTLVALFPAQTERLDTVLAEDFSRIQDGHAKANGVALGRRAAEAILALRANDGSQHEEPRIGIEFFPSDARGKWRQDPISRNDLALGAFWGGVRPFVLRSSEQFRVPPPPALESPAYAAAFNEVKQLGGDGVVTPTIRNQDQTIAGIYWAYDGTPSLCAPPRLYNQITVEIAEQRGSDTIELARLLALVNVAMADGGIAIWESKYFYQFWRPVTGIREADAGTGPTGAGDGNPATSGDPAFTPLAAPDFTPPFPAYPSGHAGFGGALFQMLRNFYRTDNIAFTFVSDEYNGETRDNDGSVRPLIPRRFWTLSEAEGENAQSRVYLGIHWAFDLSEGIVQGRRIADFVFRNAFVPVRERSSDRDDRDSDRDGRDSDRNDRDRDWR